MRILSMNPVNDGRGGHACVATVDVELNEHVRMYGLRLMRMRDGKHLVYAPQVGQRRAATFSTPLAEQLTTMAVEALGNVNAA